MNKFLTLLLVLCATIATMTMGERTSWVPRETGLVLPAPVAAPAAVPAPEAAVAPVVLVSAAPVLAPAIAATTSNTWVNARTCGWVSGVSCKSRPTEHRSALLSAFVYHLEKLAGFGIVWNWELETDRYE